MRRRYKTWELALAVIIAFTAGLAAQWLLFEKELWIWGIREDQHAIRVHIERLEARDLAQLIQTLERYGQEIERALLVLGYNKLKAEPEEATDEKD